MDTTTIIALAIGAGQLLFAFLTWMGFDRKLMTNKVAQWFKQRVRIVPILLLGGFLFSGLGFYRAFTHDCSRNFRAVNLVEVKERNFVNQQVQLDGYHYRDCTFTNVSFTYNGTAGFAFEHNKLMGGFRVNTENQSVLYTFILLKGLDMMRDDIPVLGPNQEPIESLKPLERK